MEIEKAKAIIEAILFAAGREVKTKDLAICLELEPEDIETIVESMKQDYGQEHRGIDIVKMQDGYTLSSKQEYYEYIYPILDKRAKPNLSTAALETLAIVAYNPKVTRAQIESIRGVHSDGTIYKLLEYGLIEEAGKLDAPGRPMMYQVAGEFYKMFGYSSLEELPELPRYKIDENEQIVIDDILENEAPEPAREVVEEKQEETKKEEIENHE